MRKVFTISLLVLLYALLCGKSCTDEGSLLEQQEEAVKAEREEVRRTFEVPYLSEGDRYASEEVAMQKLADLADLVAVFTDPALDTSFRAQAGMMIRQTFLSDTSALSFHPRAIPGEEMTVGMFLRQGPAGAGPVTWVRFDSIHVLEPMKRSMTGHYEGVLGCTQKLSPDGPYSSAVDKEEIRVGMHAVRIPKVFGDDTLRVWEVWLGDMVARGR